MDHDRVNNGRFGGASREPSLSWISSQNYLTIRCYRQLLARNSDPHGLRNRYEGTYTKSNGKKKRRSKYDDGTLPRHSKDLEIPSTARDTYVDIATLEEPFVVRTKGWLNPKYQD